MKLTALVDGVTALGALAVLIAAAVVVRGRDRQTALNGVGPVWISGADGLQAGGNVIGGTMADLRVVEFGDYQCPVCVAAQPSVDSLLRRFTGDVALVFRQFPLVSIHPNALTAALASECAAMAHSFDKFHHLLFARGGQLSDVQWGRLAHAAGIADTVAFDRCLKTSATRAAVDSDIAVGRETGVEATPTFIIAGWRFDGFPGMPVLDSAIRANIRPASSHTHL